MFESVAFQCGVIAISVTTIFSCLHWILSVYNGVRVEKVALLQDPFFPIFKITRNSVELILGWLPMGSYVKIAGMVDESMDRGTETETEDFIHPYEFRGKPLGTRALILYTSPIVLMLLGGGILTIASPVSIGELVVLYFNISLFLAPIDAGTEIWESLYTDPLFLMGFITFFMGFSNSFTSHIPVFCPDKDLPFYIPLLGWLCMIIFSLPLFRLVWMNLSLMNVVYYFIGGILTGLVAFAVSMLLASFLPNH